MSVINDKSNASHKASKVHADNVGKILNIPTIPIPLLSKRLDNGDIFQMECCWITALVCNVEIWGNCTLKNEYLLKALTKATALQLLSTYVNLCLCV